MSPDCPDSDSNPASPDEVRLDAELRDLEKRLARLQPAEPRPGCLQEAVAKMPRRSRSHAHPARAAAEESGQSRRWRRLVPLGIAAVVTFTGILLLNHLAQTPSANPVSAEAKAEAASGRALDFAAVPANFDQLVPVSVESVLREVESTDIVVVEGQGPMRPVLMHYEAAQCWFDPVTLTTIQVIQPWQETVFYPVETY